MKAVIIKKYGDAQQLKMGRIARPSIGPEEVLVEVKAIGINPIDWKIRSGKFKAIHQKKFPMVLGTDFSGVVNELGKKVKDFKKGDLVFSSLPAMQGQGAYAEYVKINAKHLAKKPEKISFEKAAAISVAGLTALQGLKNKCRIQKNMQVLINGASGGVGHFAVQLAKHLGAEVTGVCSDRNTEFVRSIGADHVINYKEKDFTKDDSTKYDIIFDAVANKSFGSCKPVMKDKSIYFNTLPTPGRFTRKVLPSLSGKKLQTIICDINRTELEILAKMLEDEILKVYVDKVFPLAEIQAAHEYSETGRTRGKIVLKAT